MEEISSQPVFTQLNQLRNYESLKVQSVRILAMFFIISHFKSQRNLVSSKTIKRFLHQQKPKNIAQIQLL